MVFVLCTHKNSLTYQTIFEELKKNVTDFDPKQITVDFELAAIKAIKNVFPAAKIQGCHFHFAQNVVHNLGQNGLKRRYETDSKFAHEIRKIIALPFIPPKQIIPVWENFIATSETLNAKKQEEDKKIADFVTGYFNNHYIGKMKKNVSRGNPQFPVELWNVYDSTVKSKYHCFLLFILYDHRIIKLFLFSELDRTNNTSEGWHNAFTAMAGKHQTIFKFIDQIRKEQSLSAGKIAKCEANASPPRSKKKYVERNAAILKAVESFTMKMEQNENIFTDDDSDDPNSDEEDDNIRSQRQLDFERRNNPFLALLNSIALNTRL